MAAAAPARKRRPTEADLNREQREIYDALPEPLRDAFLKQLPAIAISGAAARRKAQVLRTRVACLDQVLQSVQAQRDRLTQLAKTLDQGGNPETVDLREEMKPPVISGAVLRFIRAEGAAEPG